MKHLHLVVPDLFPPREIASEVCAGLQLPSLEKLLSRGKTSPSPVLGLEDRLCDLFGVQSVAPVRAAFDGLEVGDAYWLCADPVNLLLQRAQMLVLPEIVPERTDRASLSEMLNAHFAREGLHFFMPHSRRWYVRAAAGPQLVTSALGRVLWRDAKFYQPRGADSLRWQRIITEVQMLLYSHPLNRAREARGEGTIGSLWLWGGGYAEPLQKAFEAIGGDSELADAFARLSGVTQYASLQTLLEGNFVNGLWVYSSAGDALQCGDLHAWRSALQRFEQEIAHPLLKALQTGNLQHLNLEVLREEAAHSFSLTRADSWKLWRPERSLARYAV